MRGLLILLVAVLGLVALFAVQNPGLITVRLFTLTVSTSLLVVIIAAFAAGVAATLLGGIPSWIRRRRRIRDLEADVAALRRPQSPPVPRTPGESAPGMPPEGPG